MDQQFYIHLPSNASMQLQPENTSASYKVSLPSRIELEGEWEVGLAEITYSVSWFNIPANEYFRVRVPSALAGFVDASGNPIEKDVGEGDFKVPEGYYEDAEQLMETLGRLWDEYWQRINSRLEDYLSTRPTLRGRPEANKVVVGSGKFLSHERRLEYRRADSETVPNTTRDSLAIKYDKFGHKASFALAATAHVLVLSPLLSDILSIEASDYSIEEGVKTYKSKNSVDLNRGNRHMYVYCSLIQDSIVGDSRVPLLRSFPLSGRKAGSVNESFSRIYYVPLKKQTFDNIEIELRNEVGQLIQFQYGHSNCVLHFRRATPRVLL